MAWRAVMRRIPTRSLTVVGDIAQTGNPAGARSWAQMLAPYVQGRWREHHLLVNYRTPAAIMRVAAEVLAEVDPQATAPLSVREEGDPPAAIRLDDLDGRAGLVGGEAARTGAGRTAVITSRRRRDEVRRALPAAADPGALDAPVAVL